MGADVLYLAHGGARPEKYQVRLETGDGDGYTVRFWWFGRYRLVPDAGLADEPTTRGIAMDPFDARFTPEYFDALLRGKTIGVKAFLMDQKNVSGIGNMYMHDILFRARLHPKHKLSDLSGGDAAALYAGVLDTLNEARARGAFYFEMDFYGEKGRFGMGDFLVGYREGAPCPVCGAVIETVKTGSTSSYICPACQK
jgi:formamidopyrimidine-DNA glycosylase